MDTVKIKSDFMRKTVSKLIEKIIRTKFGYNMHVEIYNVDITSIDGDIKFALNLGGNLSKEEVQKILKEVI